jgi:hypothetical protein
VSASAAEPAPHAGSRSPGAALLLVVAVGSAAAWTLSSSAPAPPGARRLAAPETLLSLFDAVAILLLALPCSFGAGGRLLLGAAAAPFHAAIAAAAGAGPGFHVAVALTAAAWGGAIGFSAARTPRLAGAAASAFAFGVPLAAYGLGDLARLPTGATFLASPLTAPVLLAHRAAEVAAVDALPSVVASALVALAAAWASRASPREETPR